jgi:hypothetical protein
MWRRYSQERICIIEAVRLISTFDREFLFGQLEEDHERIREMTANAAVTESLDEVNRVIRGMQFLQIIGVKRSSGPILPNARDGPKSS